MTRRRAWLLALTATATMSVSYFDRQTLSVLAPTVTAELHVSERQYGLLGSAFAIAYLVAAPLAGRIIDRVGARRGLVAAVLLWSVVSALHALVPGFGALFAARIALGLAESPSFPGAAQTMHRALPPADRSRGLGVLFTGSSIGAMLAPPLATFMESRWGWRAAFLGTAIVGLLWIPLWISVAFARDARAAIDHAPEHVPAPASRGAPAEPAARPSWSEILVVASHPAFLRGAVAILASAPAIGFLLNWGAKYMVRELGVTQAAVGKYLWLPPVLFDVGAIGFGHFASVSDRVRRGGAERGLFAIASTLAVTIALVPALHGPWGMAIVAGVAMAGGGGAYALLTADLLARVAPGQVSTAGGLCAAAQSIAQIVSFAILGALVDPLGGYRWICVGLGVWVIPGSIAWVVFRPPPAWREAAS